MPPKKEDVTKAKISTLKLKINTYTDVELQELETCQSADLDEAAFREALKEYENIMCTKFAATADNVELERISSEYAKEARAYDTFIAKFSLKLAAAKLALNPDAAAPQPEAPVSQGPTPQQKIQVLEACISSFKVQVKKEIEEIKTKMAGVTTLTLQRRNCFKAAMDLARDSIETRFYQMYQEKAELEPDDAVAILGQYNTAKNSIMPELVELYYQLANIPDDVAEATGPRHSTPAGSLNSSMVGGALAASTNAAVKSMQYSYKVQDIPAFNGKDYASYPDWKREWQQSVSMGKSQIWVITNLNKYTPDWVKLDGCTTIDECWDELDLHFANPMAVSTELMTSFEKFKPEGNEHQRIVSLCDQVLHLQRNLKTVQQEEMLSANMYVINKIIMMLPRPLQKDFSKLRNEANVTARNASGNPVLNTSAAVDTMTSKELFKLLIEFLKSEKIQAITYHSHELHKAKDSSVDSKKPTKKVNAIAKKSPGAGGQSGGSGGQKKTPLTQQEIEEKRRKKHEEFGKCPACKEDHTYTTQRGTFASSRLHDCPKWKGLPQNKKLDTVINAGGCSICTSWVHATKDCNSTRKECGHIDGGDKCTKHHSRYFHALTHPYVINHLMTSPAPDSTTPILLHINKVFFPNGIGAAVLTDDGSSISAITYDLANKLGLKGTETWETLAFAAHAPKTEKVMTYQVRFPLIDGSFKMIKMIGFEYITEGMLPVDVDPAYSLFPKVPYGALERPEEQIDILIGQDQVDLLPDVEFKAGTLRALSLKFGTGWTLGGYHEDIKSMQHVVINHIIKEWKNARVMARGPQITVNHISRIPAAPCICCAIQHLPTNFMEAEETGVMIPRRCKKCTSCTNCSFQGNGMSLKEFQELEELRNGVSYDPELKRVKIKYAYNNQVTLFQDNQAQAEKRAISQEKSLTKKGFLEVYNDCVQDYKDRGVWVEVSRQEIDDWKAQGLPIHFIAHHCVLNDGSKSTPVRVVLDSTLKNNYQGPSLNDVLCKGPNGLSNLFDVMMRWRSYPVAMVFDLSKAYHQIMCHDLEKMTRLVVWRDGDTSKPFKVYGNTRVGMGDRPAVNALELGTDKAAEVGEHIDPPAAEKLKRDRFADDVLTGGDKAMVLRMRGKVFKKDDGTIVFDGTIPKILEMVSFKAKSIIMSGESDPDILAKLGKVLGHLWIPQSDELEFKLTINLHGKNGASRLGPDLTLEVLQTMDNFQITRRICLQIVAGFYDPLGLVCVYLIRWKIALKEVTALQSAWDDPLPKEEQSKWLALMKEVLETEAQRFPRAFITEGAIGRPEYIVYFDGSSQAYCCVVYARWRMETGGWKAVLMSAKVRVTSQQGMTIPRSELSGLVLAVRLTDTIYKAVEEKPRRISIIGDSTCTISSCESGCTSLAPYFANRVAEIVDKMQSWGPTSPQPMREELKENPGEETFVDLINHTPGTSNIADLPTRGTVNWDQIGPESEWQRGPNYLQETRDSWPVSRDFIPDLPQEELKSKYQRFVNLVTKQGIPKPTKPSLFTHLREVVASFKPLTKVRGIVARVMRMHVNKGKIEDPLTPADYELADKILAYTAMPETVDALQNSASSLSSLAPFVRDGLLFTRGRMGKSGTMLQLGHGEMLILSPKSHYARLVMEDAHNEDHRQCPGTTLWRSRKGGKWIIRGRNLAKTVTSQCLKCKIFKQAPTTQLMANLPSEVQDVGHSPFKHIALDILGPHTVVDVNRRRVGIKTFPILFTCLNTRALHVHLALGYSTDEFMTVFKDYVALKGCPQTVYSDAGNQLVKAGKLLQQDQNQGDISWQKISELTASKGITWTSAPAYAQFRNGRMESLCRQFKETLHHLTGGLRGRMFHYMEFQSLLREACSIVNDRPIGYRHHGGAEGELQPITPNMLLLTSRTNSPLPVLDAYDEWSTKDARTLRMRETCLQQWWEAWYRVAFDSMVVRSKWKTSVRNVRIGDIVLMRSQAKLGPGDYKRGKVDEVFVDDDGLVRTALVQCYKPDSRRDVAQYKGEGQVKTRVAVQRLVVLLPVEEQEGHHVDAHDNLDPISQ